jgi:hypothetical protein
MSVHGFASLMQSYILAWKLENVLKNPGKASNFYVMSLVGTLLYRN